MMAKKTSTALFIFLLLAILYLFMKITNMKIDLSVAGLHTENTETYERCLREYYDEYSRLQPRRPVAAYDYCASIIPERERFKKVFRFPKVYFAEPR